MIMRNFIITVLVILSSTYSVVTAAGDDVFEIETEGGYPMVIGSSNYFAKEMALFIAKKKAVDLAGRYLSRKSLIGVLDKERDEIYSLTAREIQAEILKEGQNTLGNLTTYQLRIKVRIQPIDFITGEIEDFKQEKKEENESYQEEMGQYLSSETDPGRDLAKAYRLLREHKWRILMIYFNHLVKKYPDWGNIYMVKAIVHYMLHEPMLMKKALNEACRLGDQTACDDLKNIKKLHEYDFGLSFSN
jgi:hypothetical protein